MREGIQGPLANCSLFSQTVFLARWTAGAKGASPSGIGAGRGMRQVAPAKGHWGRPRPNLRVSSSAPRRAGPSTCGSSRLALLGTATNRRFPRAVGGGRHTRWGRRPAQAVGEFSWPRRTSHHAKAPATRCRRGQGPTRSSRQCYCCARQRFIFMWRRTKYVASRAMIAASTTSTAVISGLCPNIPTVNVLEEFASV